MAYTCSCNFPTVPKYRKGGQVGVHGFSDLEGVHGAITTLDLGCVRLRDCSDFKGTIMAC